MRRNLGLAFCMIFFALGLGLHYSFSSPVDTSQKSKVKAQKKSSRNDQERPQYYKKWLDEDVIYIITEEEEAVFKSLKTEEERETFIEQFWGAAIRIRDPHRTNSRKSITGASRTLISIMRLESPVGKPIEGESTLRGESPTR